MFKKTRERIRERKEEIIDIAKAASLVALGFVIGSFIAEWKFIRRFVGAKCIMTF